MFTWSTATLTGAVCRLALMFSPLVGLWALVCALLLLHEAAAAHFLALGILAVGPGAAWRLVKNCFIEVPLRHALIVENRNKHQLQVWLTGYHICLPGLYRVLSLAQMEALIQQRILENVLMGGGPLTTLKITYTLQHSIPPHALRLPRAGLTRPAFQRATRIANNIFEQAQRSEHWNRQQSAVLDACFREFFAGVPSPYLYDPTGSEQLAPQILYCKLNHYLAVHVERECGLQVYVNSLEVLVTPQQRTQSMPHLRRVA